MTKYQGNEKGDSKNYPPDKQGANRLTPAILSIRLVIQDNFFPDFLLACKHRVVFHK